MKLKAYLAERKLSRAEFGSRLSRPRPSQTITRWCHGTHVPGPEDVAAIYLATGGRVTPNDFYDLPPLPNGRAQEAA